MPAVLIERQAEIAILRLNRPESLNAINEDTRRELTQAQFDDILFAARKYQKRAYESGEPQKLMREFLAARRPKK